MKALDEFQPPPLFSDAPSRPRLAVPVEPVPEPPPTPEFRVMRRGEEDAARHRAIVDGKSLPLLDLARDYALFDGDLIALSHAYGVSTEGLRASVDTPVVRAAVTEAQKELKRLGRTVALARSAAEEGLMAMSALVMDASMTPESRVAAFNAIARVAAIEKPRALQGPSAPPFSFILQNVPGELAPPGVTIDAEEPRRRPGRPRKVPTTDLPVSPPPAEAEEVPDEPVAEMMNADDGLEEPFDIDALDLGDDWDDDHLDVLEPPPPADRRTERTATLEMLARQDRWGDRE